MDTPRSERVRIIFRRGIIGLLGLLLATFLLNVVRRQARRRQQLRRVATEHDVKPPKYDLSSYPFGISKFFCMVRNYQSQTLLDYGLRSFQELGDTYVSRVLGMDVFFTCDPENIKHILQRRFDDFDIGPLRRHLFAPVNPEGIFGFDGAEWRARRKLFRVHFTDTRSVVDLDNIESHLQNMIDQIPSDGSDFDIQKLFVALMTDVLGTVASGESMHALSAYRNPEELKVDEALDFVKAHIAKFGMSKPLSLISDTIRFRRAGATVRQYMSKLVLKIVDESEKKEKGFERSSRGSFIRGSLQETHDPAAVRDQAASIYLAGIESVAALLSAAFRFLSQDQRVFEKLKSSVLERFGPDTRPSYDDLGSVSYLRYVQNEALRLMPPVPFNAKIANKDTWLPRGGGVNGNSSVLIKKGQIVSFWSWASHRKTEIFGSDVDSFYPERWETIKEDVSGFIPFQPGQRVCPGQRIAMTTASYIIIRLLQHYDSLECRDTKPWREQHGLGLLSAHGVRVALSSAPSLNRIPSLPKYRYLLYSHYPKGHSLPMQAVAKALVDRGHQVVWLVSPENQGFVEATGATFAPTRAISKVDAALIAQNPQTALATARARMRGRVLAEVEDYRRVLADFQADCILADVLPLGARACYDLGEVPVYATMGVIPLGYSAATCPQWGSGRRPASSFLARSLNKLQHNLNHYVFYPLILSFPYLNPQRAKLGLGPIPLGEPAELFTCSPHLHLQASCAELEYHDESVSSQPSPSVRVRYTGPLVLGSEQSTGAHPLPPWWDEIASHPRLVGLTQGTMAMDPSNLIVPAIKALTHMQELDVVLVVTTPHADRILAEIGKLPRNVHLVSWFPYDLLLPRLAALITNGGYGGITQALVYGVPIVCAGRTEDKIDTAARVSWVGAGVDLKTNVPGAKQLRDALTKVMGDESYRQNARRVGESLKALGGAETAAGALEELVREAKSERLSAS